MAWRSVTVNPNSPSENRRAFLLRNDNLKAFYKKCSHRDHRENVEDGNSSVFSVISVAIQLKGPL